MLVYAVVMTTVAVPMNTNGPNVQVMAPVDVAVVNVTGIPIKAGLLDCVTVPERAIMPPETEPVSVYRHTPGLPGGLGPGGGESVPLPDNDEAVPEACAVTVTVPTILLLT